MIKKAIVAALSIFFIGYFASPASADYGSGSFTYNEWLNLHSGETMGNVQQDCTCFGTWVNKPSTNPKVYWYDNSDLHGYVAEYYVWDNVTSHWRTYGSYWCDQYGNCQKGF